MRMSLLRTHPDLYDRLLAVGVQPDYPRPEPPEPSFGAIMLGASFGLLLVLAIDPALVHGLKHSYETEGCHDQFSQPRTRREMTPMERGDITAERYLTFDFSATNHPLNSSNIAPVTDSTSGTNHTTEELEDR